VQSTLAGLLDGFSRALGDSGGLPDVISLSFGNCAFTENRGLPAYTAVINAVLAMTSLAGVSSFVAAGDSGSTTCGTSVPGPPCRIRRSPPSSPRSAAPASPSAPATPVPPRWCGMTPCSGSTEPVAWA
jgi:subtilisin family serine protease